MFVSLFNLYLFPFCYIILSHYNCVLEFVIKTIVGYAKINKYYIFIQALLHHRPKDSLQGTFTLLSLHWYSGTSCLSSSLASLWLGHYHHSLISTLYTPIESSYVHVHCIQDLSIISESSQFYFGYRANQGRRHLGEISFITMFYQL